MYRSTRIGPNTMAARSNNGKLSMSNGKASSPKSTRTGNAKIARPKSNSKQPIYASLPILKHPNKEKEGGLNESFLYRFC